MYIYPCHFHKISFFPPLRTNIQPVFWLLSLGLLTVANFFRFNFGDVETENWHESWDENGLLWIPCKSPRTSLNSQEEHSRISQSGIARASATLFRAGTLWGQANNYAWVILFLVTNFFPFSQGKSCENLNISTYKIQRRIVEQILHTIWTKSCPSGIAFFPTPFINMYQFCIVSENNVAMQQEKH